MAPACTEVWGLVAAYVRGSLQSEAHWAEFMRVWGLGLFVFLGDEATPAPWRCGSTHGRRSVLIGLVDVRLCEDVRSPWGYQV